MRRSLTVAVALGIGACHAGPDTQHFAPAVQPRGIQVNVELRGSRIPGELLEVQDSALLLLRPTGTQVVLVPLREIRSAVFQQRGVLIYHGAFVGGGTAAQLRLLSRYPTGLTPGLRSALLAAYGQSEPEVAR